jgi:hypothetical protein
LSEVAHGKSIRFKPEIKLSDYSDRPDALEEIKLVLGVFPKGTFPPSPQRANNQQRSVQLRALSQRVPKGTPFKAALEELDRDDLQSVQAPRDNPSEELPEIIERTRGG